MDSKGNNNFRVPPYLFFLYSNGESYENQGKSKGILFFNIPAEIEGRIEGMVFQGYHYINTVIVLVKSW